MPFQDMEGDENTSGARSALAFRWFLGVLLAVLSAIIGWLVNQTSLLRERQDVLIEKVGMLQTQAEARAQFYVPIIMQNQMDIVRIDKQVDKLSDRQDAATRRLDRIDRVEKIGGGDGGQ